MTTIINGDSPSVTFSDSTVQTTAFTTNPIVNNIKSQAATPLTFAINATEAMRIDSSGNLLVGATTQNSGAKFTLDSASSVALSIVGNTTASQGRIYFINPNGLVGQISTSGSATTYSTSSDYRLKTVIAPVSDSGTRLDALQPIEYDWKAGGRTRGFLAHQFAEVYPSSVSGEKDAVDKDGKPVYQAMQASTPEVMADLIAEIQSLRKRVALAEEQQALITQLQADVAALKVQP